MSNNMPNNKETKSDRFKRLAEKRTKKALGSIRVLSNLSNKGLYDYTPEQARKIASALREAVNKADARFKGEGKEEIEFKL